MASPAPFVVCDGEKVYARIEGFYCETLAGAFDRSGSLATGATNVEANITRLPFYIGRTLQEEVDGVQTVPEQWLAVGQRQMSRTHAKIAWDGQQFTLRCLGPAGCEVGKAKVVHDEVVPLPSQTPVRIGGMFFFFLSPQQAVKKRAAPGPRVPWKSVLARVIETYLSSFIFFTVSDLARLAPSACPDIALPEDTTKIRAALVEQLKPEKLAALGLEAVDLADVPADAIKALSEHHKTQQKVWYKQIG